MTRRRLESPSPTSQAIAIPGSLAVLRALEQQRRKLTRQIARKRKELERFKQERAQLMREVLTSIQPFLQQGHSLDAEVHRLFDEILHDGELTPRNRKLVREMYELIQTLGLISCRLHTAAATGDHDDSDDDDGPRAARAAGAEEHTKQLRETFLRLAYEFHPDRTHDEDTQRRHTEIMKQINRAYHDGDAGALFELEQSLEVDGESPGGPSTPDAQLARLKAQVAMLRRQFRALGKERTSLRKSPEGGLLIEYRRLEREHNPDPLGAIVDGFAAELATLEITRDFVQRFRDGDMTLKEFLRGPATADDDEDERWEIVDDLVALAVRKGRRR